MFALRFARVLAIAITAAGALAGETAGSRTALTPEAKGDVLMARKMYREAIDAYAAAPKDSASRWNKTGIAYHQLGDLSAARKSYEHAVKLDPRLGEAINNLGTIFYGLKSYRRAIREYKRALREQPESALIYSNLGTAYFARQDFKRAGETYQKALELDPEVFERRGTFGVMLQEHSVGDRAKFHYYLAKTYAKEGMTERALLCIRKSLEEGFEERKRYLDEPEFATLRSNREFLEIMQSDPRVL